MKEFFQNYGAGFVIFPIIALLLYAVLINKKNKKLSYTILFYLMLGFAIPGTILFIDTLIDNPQTFVQDPEVGVLSLIPIPLALNFYLLMKNNNDKHAKENIDRIVESFTDRN